MSNKWAELHGGHYDHNERMYYDGLGLSTTLYSGEVNSSTSTFSGIEDIDAYYEKIQERKDIIGVIIVSAIILIANMIG